MGSNMGLYLYIYMCIDPIAANLYFIAEIINWYIRYCYYRLKLMSFHLLEKVSGPSLIQVFKLKIFKSFLNFFK